MPSFTAVSPMHILHSQGPISAAPWTFLEHLAGGGGREQSARGGGFSYTDDARLLEIRLINNPGIITFTLGLDSSDILHGIGVLWLCAFLYDIFYTHESSWKPIVPPRRGRGVCNRKPYLVQLFCWIFCKTIIETKNENHFNTVQYISGILVK